MKFILSLCVCCALVLPVFADLNLTDQQDSEITAGSISHSTNRRDFFKNNDSPFTEKFFSAENDSILEKSNLSSIYQNQNEVILYSFKTKNGKSFCLSKEVNDKYLVYKFGTELKIELEFPEDKKDSWNNFKYNYYFRGGGPDNEGLDENKLTFVINEYQYTVYDTYYAPANINENGILITNSKTNTQTDLKAIPETVRGTLNVLRDLPVTDK